MKIYIFTFLFFLSVNQLSSQWIQQNSGTNLTLKSAYFLDNDLGWIGADSGKVLYTTNGGENWKIVSVPSINSILSIHFISKNYGWCASDYQLFKSTDGGKSWAKKYENTGDRIESVYVQDENNIWAVLIKTFTGGMIIKSTNGGNNWVINAYLTNPSRPSKILFINELVGFVVGGEKGRIFKTTNGGQSWELYLDNLVDRYNDIAFKDENNGIVVGNSSTIANTSNSGVTWNKKQLRDYHSYRKVEYKENNIWFINSKKIYFSNNNGNDWFIQKELNIPEAYFTDIFFINNSIGWIIGNKGLIFKTTNSGFPIVKTLPQTPQLIEPVNEIDDIEMPFSFIWEEKESSKYHLQVSYDINFSNIVLEDTLFNNFRYSILSEYSSYYWRVKSINLFGESEWSNIFRFTTSIINNMDDDKLLTNHFRLEQNYPNPFNPITKIRYSIPQSENVQLKIFDILGNEIAVIINEYMVKGYYEVEFNLNNYQINIPSGIYIYRLISGDNYASKKMIIMK